jgi:hypothetical protein
VPGVNDEVERELSSISRGCYQTAAVPRLVATVSSRFESSAVFFTDGSKGEAGTEFGVYQLNGGKISFRLREPDHVMWSCDRYDSEKQQLWNDLRVAGTSWRTLVRDLLGCKDWRGLHECCSFLKRCNVKQ